MTNTDLTSNRQNDAHKTSLNRLSDRALVLFTRVPIAGKSKTRLQSALTPQQCADVQMALICDTAEELSNLDCDIVVAYAPDHEDQENAEELFMRFQEKLNTCHRNTKRPLRFIRQEGKSLGERMDNAFAQVFCMGARHCLLMGSDIPNVSVAELDKLFLKLNRRDVVLCPSQDGGYWLVGLNERFQDLFENKRFGCSSVLAESIRTCSEFEKDLAFGPKKMDIDTPRQLQRYSMQLHSNVLAHHHMEAVLKELNLPHAEID